MFAIEDLKEQIIVTDTSVECPVKGCTEKVEQQRKVFRREARFKCQRHNIYISPSTFEYKSEWDNMLWTDEDDRELFQKIKTIKRESRIARDNSEDAVSWNVFRFLERNNLVGEFLSSITGSTVNSPEVIYWSYNQSENSSWSLLNKARKEFGEAIQRGSEPDIIVKSDKAIFFIEAKFMSGNETVPSNKKKSKKYETGGDHWYSKVFKTDFRTLAIDEKKYELLRFWLLGAWMAQRADTDFYLINLVLSERELNIEDLFKKHINENPRRKFLRLTWEDVYQYILSSGASKEKDIITANAPFRSVPITLRLLQTCS